MALGVSDPEGVYVPLWDTNIHAEMRAIAFGEWVSGYFAHGNLASKDFAQLNQRRFDIHEQPPTVSRMSEQDLNQATSIGVGSALDTSIISPGYFQKPLAEQALRSFSMGVRNMWNGIRICVLYGEACAWPMIYGVWWLEGVGESAGIEFIPIAGANHFVSVRCRRFTIAH